DADADRRHAPALAALAEHLGQRAEDAASAGAERVAERYRAPALVDDLGVAQAVLQPGVHADQRLDGERLVELDGADLVPADAGPAQRGVRRLHGGVAERLRLQRERAPAGDPGDRVEPDPL